KHLARPDEFGHGADRLFNRHLRVNAVLVIKINVFGAESLQRFVHDFSDMFGAAVGPGGFSVRSDLEAELGGNDDLIAPAFERAADELFVLIRAVNPAHAHTAEAERGNDQSLTAQLSLFHSILGGNLHRCLKVAAARSS